LSSIARTLYFEKSYCRSSEELIGPASVLVQYTDSNTYVYGCDSWKGHIFSRRYNPIPFIGSTGVQDSGPVRPERFKECARRLQVLRRVTAGLSPHRPHRVDLSAIADALRRGQEESDKRTELEVARQLENERRRLELQRESAPKITPPAEPMAP